MVTFRFAYALDFLAADAAPPQAAAAGNRHHRAKALSVGKGVGATLTQT